jgi:transcription factor TGA
LKGLLEIVCLSFACWGIDIVVQILIPQIEPLTEQQLVGICNLQQSSQEAEDALSQGMEALQQSLADTVANGLLGRSPTVANYMSQMAMAMGKLSMLESFVHQVHQFLFSSLNFFSITLYASIFL